MDCRRRRWVTGDKGALALVGALLGLAAAAAGFGLSAALRPLGGPGEAPAPARWAACAAGSDGLTTAALPLPNGVLVRASDDRGGAAMALVPSKGAREAAALLDALGCRSMGHPDGP